MFGEFENEVPHTDRVQSRDSRGSEAVHMFSKTPLRHMKDNIFFCVP